VKIFLTFAIVINTLIFGSLSYYNYLSYKYTEKNFQEINRNIDTMNVRLKGIKVSLDDKLYGIIANLPKK
jgi:hypothetical protein